LETNELKLLLPLLLLMQAGDVPYEVSPDERVDYAAARRSWSMCAHLTIMGAAPKLLSAARIKALLTTNCAAEAEDFETKLAAFIRVEGDPRGTAAPIAKAQTERVRQYLIEDMAAKLQRRVMMRDRATTPKWIACLEARKSPCAAEETAFVAAAQKALKADGVAEADIKAITAQFIKRTRQRIANAAVR
jgi:hypothetical protein